MVYRILGLAVLVLSLGCSKTEEHGDHHHGPPDMTAQLKIHVEAMEGGGATAPLQGAQIFLKETVAEAVDHHHHPDGDATAVTDEHGNVTITLAADVQYAVHISADGYDTRVRRVNQADGTERQLWVTTSAVQRQTITIPDSGAIEVKLGNTMGGSQAPVTLTIEAGDLAADSGSGAVANGEIDIVYGSWDPAIDPPSALPSDLVTADAPLFSYGMFHVEFYQGDTVLNVRDGQTIRFDQVVNATRRLRAQNALERGALNVYSLDHNTGLWVKDEATTTFSEETGALTSEATHFSHKNHDEPGPFPANSCMNITGVNRDGVPVNASIEVQGFGAPNGNGCINMACLIGDDGNVLASEDINGNGVLDPGEDTNGNGVLDGANDLRRGIAGNVRRAIAAARQVPGHNYWQRNNVTADTVCDDNERILGCGVGSCADVQVLLCSPQGEACNERADCCDRLGCFNDVCDVCREAQETCGTSDECCPGTDCIDFTCRPTR